MKLSHARGATQDGQVMVERADRMWSTGEGNGKLLQYSCLENPMNSMKRASRNSTKSLFLPQFSHFPWINDLHIVPKLWIPGFGKKKKLILVIFIYNIITFVKEHFSEIFTISFQVLSLSLGFLRFLLFFITMDFCIC